MRDSVRGADPPALGRCWRCSSRRSARPIWLSQRIPSTFLPVEDQGYFFVVIQLPDGASLERTDAVAKQVRDILQNTPGVDIVGSISGLNFLTSAAQSNSAVEFAILKPWDERPPEQNASKIVAAVRPKLLGLPGRLRAELRSALDPRPRRDRRLRVPGRGSDRARQRGARTRRRRRVIAEARKQPEINRAAAVLVLQHVDAAVQLRPRPQQGEAARPQPAGRVQHAADLSRLALRQRLQPVRPHLPRDPAGRQGRARRRRRPVAPLCAQRLRRHGAAEHARHAASRSSGRRPCRTTTTTPPRSINGGAAPGFSSGPGGRRDGAGRRDGPAARFRLRMDRHHLPGAEGGLDRDRRLRARHRLRLPDPRGAIRELDHAVHGAARGAARAVRRARWRCGCAACRSTSIRRSASSC